MKTFAILFLTCSLGVSVMSAPQLEHGLQLSFLPKSKNPASIVKPGFTVIQPKSSEETAGVDADKILRYYQNLPESTRTN